MRHLFKQNSLLTMFLLSMVHQVYAQPKTEGLTIQWPTSYKWKIIEQRDRNNVQTIRFIPGNETKANASLLCTVAAYSGLKYSSLDELINHYQQHIDTGTILTVLEKNTVGSVLLVLFKAETSSSKKYPEPESDLYYVVQGTSSLFENYIAIKQPSLSKSFIEKWTEVLKTARLTYE